MEIVKKTISTNLNISVRILTPVHIGAGAEKNLMKNLDYFLIGKSVYVLNQGKLFETLESESEFQRALDLMTAEKLDEFKDYVIDIKKINPKDVSSKILNFNSSPNARIREIKSLISDGINGAYIPGSSIKGAIANVLFHYLYMGKNMRGTERNVYADLMGNFQTSIMRYVRPYDVFLDKTEVSEIKLFNLYFNGTWESRIKKEFQIFAETFMPDAKGKFRLGIADGFLDIMKKKGMEAKMPKHHADIFKENPVQFLFDRINAYTRKYLDKEITFFQKYDQADITPDVLEKLVELREMTINNPRSCVLRLAFGSGFHGITGDWRLHDHLGTIEKPDQLNLVYSKTSRQKEPARYKSRRIRHDGMPMGFIELILPEDAAPIAFEKITEEKRPVASEKTNSVQEVKQTTRTQNVENASEQTQKISYPKGVIPIAAEEINDKETVFFAQFMGMKGKFAGVLPLIKGKSLYAVMELPRGVKLDFQEIVKVKVAERAANGEITKLIFVSK